MNLLFFKLQIKINRFISDLKPSISIWWHWYSPPWKKTRRCPQCGGNGQYVSEVDARYRSIYSADIECSMCNGTGKVSKECY